MRPDDLPAIAALHEGGNPKGNLSRRRPMEYWEYLVREKGLDNYRVIQSERDLTGYFRIEASTGDVRLHEVAAVTEDACQGILRSACEAARDHGAGLLIVHCPHQSTFGSHLRQRGAAEYSPFADRLTSLQLKILDLPGCLRLLTADLSRRVERSELAGCQAKYQFATEDDRVVVRTGKGKVAVTEDAAQARRISIPSRTMAQLVCGFGTFRHEAEWHPPAEEARLLEVLFPPGEPYWHVDDL